MLMMTARYTVRGSFLMKPIELKSCGRRTLWLCHGLK